MEQNAVHAEGAPARAPSASNVVTIPCYCPGTPHEFDTVTLAPDVSIRLGIAAGEVLRRASNMAETLGDLITVYLRLGVTGWSLVDAKGQPEEVTPDNVTRLLTYDHGGYEVANVADDLYSAVVMRPLLAARQKSSRNGQTGGSTPPRRTSGSKHPRPSMPSSPTGTDGVAFVVPAP